MANQRNHYRDLVAVLFLFSAAFLAVAFFTYHPADPIPENTGPIGWLYQHDPVSLPTSPTAANACGVWGSLIANVFHNYFGLATFYILASLVGVAVWMIRQPYIGSPVARAAGWFASLMGISTLLSLLLPHLSAGPIIGGGGYLGAVGRMLLDQHFASTGSLILAASISSAGILIFSDYTFFRSIKWLFVSSLGAVVGAGQTAAHWNTLRPRIRTDRAAGNSGAAIGEELSESALQVDSEADIDELEEESEDRPYTIRIQGRTDLYEQMKNGDLDAEAFDEDESDDQEYDVELESEEEAATEPVARGKVLKKKRAASETDASSEEIAEEEQNSNLPIPSSHPHFKLKKREARKTDEVEREKVKVALNQASLIEQESDYAMPDIRLLQHGKGPSFEDQEREVRRKAVILEKTFREFGFKIKVVEIETGPVIAQYEIEMEAGLRLSKITNLADDLAIALRVPSVRIVAPIPGKCTVGIEIPNEQRMMVCLRDVMEESAGKTSKMKIPLFLGKDVSGNPMVADLAALPHLLIAGRTGTGKSVCLNAIITSILMTRRPDEVRMLMIDPKMVELSGYARLPHLMHPVVTDMRKAEAILAWAVDKMEERYALLARAGVRHLTSYNQLDEDELWSRMQIEDEDEKKEIPRSLPFIVIVADEMADLMMTAGKEVEQHIIRLAQKSRAVGIHLILATQKPTVDVITGLIKSNLPSRIAFQVASKTDSRVVLDENGADKLLGNGDMLFLGPGTSILMRGQGTYLSDEEIDMITDTVSTNHQSFAPELVNLKIEGGQTASNDTKKANQRDEEYEQAVDVVVREGRGSVSLIQRSLAIGYGKAARLVDFMAEDGIVGDYKGSKARDVLVSAEEWEQMKAKGDSPDDEPPSSPPKKPAKKGKSSKAAAKLMQAASSSFSATNAADDVDFDESAATLPPTKSRNRTVTLIDRDATDAYEEEISLDSDQEDQYEDEVIDAGDDDDADEYEAAYDDAEDDADVEYEAEDEYEDDEDEDEEYDEAEDEADDEYEDDVEYEDDEIEAWEVASESDDDDQYEAEDEYSDEEDSEYEEDDEYEYEDADAHDAESELGGKAAIPKPRLFRGNDDEEGEYWETA